MTAEFLNEDDETEKEVVQSGDSRIMWIIFTVAGFVGLVVLLGFIFRIIWRRIQHQKIKRDTPQKPLTLRRPTPAVKSPATNQGSGHYLKKSPSPTGLSPLSNTSGNNSPSPTGSTQQRYSPKESPTSEETSGPSLAEESANATVHVEDETCSVDSKLTKSDDGSIKITTSQEILTGTLGQLFFNIRYKKEKNTLIVSILKCQNLPSKDSTSANSDPYVKLQLLPEKQHKVKTRVLRKTRNPVYEEDFSFYGIKINQLQSITLHFIVLTFDRYSRDEIIGEVFFPLSSVDIINQDNTNVTFQKDIQPRSLKVKSQGRGEMLVSLCWQPAANRLTVVILKARNLPKMDVTGLADPYVKIYLMYKGQRIAKKKTHVKKRTLNPVFNESFVFEVPSGNDGLHNISLEFLLLDWDRVTKNEVIGRLEMGAASDCESASHHWTEVCNSPRRQIADWHKLHE
ncbi:synaptotagmin-4-like [Planococcus citri]|uniref:synaptotagmin-4-like n=1 Tax=Planococcus citri TaxID=170843 RepID=UPI0031F8DF3A